MAERHPSNRDVQRVIKPETGEDITGEYIREKLIELEKIADGIISDAVIEYEKFPDNRLEIVKRACQNIHERLGMGSIGPATAVAAPLMEKKLKELADKLKIPLEEIYKHLT